MLDEFCNRLNPPCHELLRLEKLQLFLIRFLGEDTGDFYQVSPGIDKGVKGIDLFLGEPLPLDGASSLFRSDSGSGLPHIHLQVL